MVLSGEVDCDEGNVRMNSLLGRNRPMRGDLSAPVKPNTRSLFKGCLTATSSPPARALVLFSGTATRFETTTSCPNGNPFRRLTTARKYNPQGSSMLRPFSLAKHLLSWHRSAAPRVLLSPNSKRTTLRMAGPLLGFALTLANAPVNGPVEVGAGVAGIATIAGGGPGPVASTTPPDEPCATSARRE